MSLLLALIAIIFAGRLILKKYHPQSVLLLTGIVLLLIAHFSGLATLSGLVKKVPDLVRLMSLSLSAIR